ncbi:MAG: hypothetical protein GXO90_02365 [FCB group bacterium]|nr:hypothetical protein [FCB group bacterium]
MTRTQTGYSRNDLVFFGVFGGLWGLSEATMGNLLHLFHVPFSGSVLSATGLVILLIARSTRNKRGSSLLMAAVAASIKLMSFTFVKVGPFVGIMMEGVLTEVIFLMLGTGWIAFLMTGLVIGVYPLIQEIVTKTILFGMDFIPVILEMIEEISRKIGGQAGWWALGLYVGLHLTVGVLAAGLAWKLHLRIEHRLKTGAD